MHRIILMVLLAIVSSNVLAEWKEVGVDATSQVTTYADPSTIHKAGNRVQMWHLFDFKTTAEAYRSLKVQSEYDCIQKQSRSLYTSSHKGNMGKGEVIGVEPDPGDWRPIPLGSPKEYLFYIACKR
ncbi:MAG: hypothetical protein IPJ27_03085 [Candidatus Accumulibacter sp.]|uniref:Surface-adhesin protein E-like domain-containing protein n=1 Tax=Candidatus Accumulibacter proximus TaxID=2954385 RepID=A0A935PWP6_9PROT|nr:hypothetical protein [Candidatus Accumulibacter proximus]